MECKECKGEIQDGQKFCPGCGAAVEAQSPEPPQEPEDLSERERDFLEKKRKANEEAKRYRLEKEELEKKLKEKEDAEKAKQQEEMTEKERLEAENAELKGRAELAAKYEETLKDTLDKRILQIPEENRDLVPTSLSVQDQLVYIETHWKKLAGADSVRVNAGKPGAGGGVGIKWKEGMDEATAMDLVKALPRFANEDQDDPDIKAKMKEKAIKLYAISG
jgi:hypothetical protein